MWIIIILAITSMACILLYRRGTATAVDGVRGGVQTGDSFDAPEASGDYRAAMILPGSCPCAAIMDLGKKRFLLNEAPMLPLPECDQPECDCYYINFDDRRDDDRRHPFGSLTNNRLTDHDSNERRNQNRRSGDEKVVADSEFE
jgi:hypothetical protein